MRFERLDLNLLVALDALLSERSVSLAAERLCLSQSATSSALARLRDYFEDELLVLQGRQMVLTARGEDLEEPVRKVLEQIKNTIAVGPQFDPATSERTISIMASDYTTEVVLSPAMRGFASTAPNLRFDIIAPADNLEEALERSSIDLVITIDGALSAKYPSETLLQDDHVVIGWNGNPDLANELDANLYFALGHITTRFGKARIPAFEDWFIRNHTRQRRVEVTAPTFLSVPLLVVGSNRIATVQRRLANQMAQHLPLKIMPLPFHVPPIKTVAHWHTFRASEKALRWVIAELKKSAETQPDAAAQPAAPVEVLGPAGLTEAYRASVIAASRH